VESARQHDQLGEGQHHLRLARSADRKRSSGDRLFRRSLGAACRQRHEPTCGPTGGDSSQYEGLYWSHLQAALDWDDAEMWLEGAIQNQWSVSQMRGQRWETLETPRRSAAKSRQRGRRSTKTFRRKSRPILPQQKKPQKKTPTPFPLRRLRSSLPRASLM